MSINWRTGRWWVMTILALAIAGYAVAILAIPAMGPPFVVEMKQTRPLLAWAHFGAGAIALACGAFQLNARLRVRFLHWHRWMGRIYVASVAIGGAAGLVMAPTSQGGTVTMMGFGLLGVGWLLTTALAWIAIRTRDQIAHRRWMIRSYALTYAAVMLRLLIPLSIAIGIDFALAYKIISFAAWVPNLIFAEWWIRRSARTA